MNFDKTQYLSLFRLQQECIKRNIPFVSYCLPLSGEIVTLVQYLSKPAKLDSIEDIDSKSGFVVVPFTKSEQHGAYLLKPDVVFVADEIEENFINRLSQINTFLSIKKPLGNELQTTTTFDFYTNVNNAIKAINSKELHKVVISKIRVEKLRDDFDGGNFFLHLCKTYPHAFVYFMQLPEVGCWFGSTPEPLLVIEDDTVKTVSLAGTQVTTGANIDSYRWKQKEIEEQEIVTHFVEMNLSAIGIENYTKTGPASYEAGNLIHLKTAFEFPETKQKNCLGDFLKILHPTPSVAGLPKAEASDFILQNEKHDRSYYTGFLGTVNINKKSAIFVNLRCLQLFDKQFVLFSGAGITASSVPENEWIETENKMLTMMNVMKTCQSETRKK